MKEESAALFEDMADFNSCKKTQSQSRLPVDVGRLLWIWKRCGTSFLGTGGFKLARSNDNDTFTPISTHFSTTLKDLSFSILEDFLHHFCSMVISSGPLNPLLDVFPVLHITKSIKHTSPQLYQDLFKRLIKIYT
jgi:hypothetical protein